MAPIMGPSVTMTGTSHSMASTMPSLKDPMRSGEMPVLKNMMGGLLRNSPSPPQATEAISMKVRVCQRSGQE